MGIITQKSIESLRAMQKQAKINCSSNTDEQALEVQVLYPDWEDLEDGTELKAGQRVNYQYVLYNVLQTHKKQETWNPVDSPSLFAKILIPNENFIPDWEQPSSTNPYMIGDKVIHNGFVWESLIDGNVWEPGAIGSESLWENKWEV